MSFNPITSIEKLINEHGSATVLRERLALAADQFTALKKESLRAEKRLVVAEKSLAKATTKIQSLEAHIKHLERQNQSLQQDFARQDSDEQGLNEEEGKILQFFFREQESSCDAVAHGVGLSHPVATHHVGSLLKQGFIRQSKASMGRGYPAKFRITHDGSSHAMKNGNVAPNNP